MFNAPTMIEAGVFTRIPAALQRGDTPSEWARVQLRGAPTPTFLEGPCFDAAGNLWVTDIPWGRLLKIAPDGSVSVGAEYDGWPNGLKFLADGTGVIADHKRGMMKFDPATGVVEPLIERRLLEPFKGCNDLTLAGNGDIYFTDQGQSGLQDPSGKLYRIRAADGRLDLVLGGIPSPNGLVLNNAETVLYLAVTRANAIWRVPLNDDGVASKVGTYIQMSGGHGPDGVTIDAEDNLVVCHTGLGAVWLFDAHGEPRLRINAPEGRMTTNCAYGGPDGRTLYMVESTTGTILTARMPAPGKGCA